MTSVLVVTLRCVEHIRGKADRVAKITFRGLTYTSKVVQNAREAIYFGESFEWPLGRDIESDEMLTIEIFNYNKYLTNKMVAGFTILLQGVLEDGELKLCEPMVDANNRILDTTITLDVRYFCPGSQPGTWDSDEFQRPLPDIVYDEVEAEAIQIAAQLNRTGEDEMDGLSVGSGHSFGSGSYGGSSYHGDEDGKSMVDRVYGGRSVKQDGHFHEMHQAREFQVAVTIVEGQQLAGLNIDPVVRVQVGDDHKYTSIKQCTNTPYFNAYFVFDYFETPLILFDKMITLSVIDATGIPGRAMLKAANVVAGGVIGMFKCDVGSVYNAPDHQFYRKWAVLLDPKDIAEGAKGYLKVDIAVVTKGEQPKVVQKLNKADENNIEGNLLLPGNMPVDRQMAAYTIIIYSGQDLPRMDAGIMASMKKAITRSNAFVDAYVKISFLGHVGKTSVKKSYNPDWKQKMTFIEMFPPMANRIKVQVYDQDAISDDCIATHFIELSQIMDPGGETEGMLPSYGPNWVNLYGSPRNFKSAEDLEPLNDGIGEGAAYRGRVLLSVKTELLDGEMSGPCSVHVDKIRTASKIEVAPRREHLLFGTLFDASMIDKEYKDKPISFELTIGMAGNNLDKKLLKGGTGIFEPSSSDEDDDEEEDDNEKRKLIEKTAVKEEEVLPSNSTTHPTVPISDDKNYYYIPTGQNKPCLYVIAKFEDLRKRIYHSNLLTRITEQVDEALDVVRTYILGEKPYAHVALAKAMHDLCKNCDRYTRVSNTLGMGSGSGKTKLDKHRLATCKANIERIKLNAKGIKAEVDKFNVKTKYKDARDILRKLKHLSREPQHSLPDVIIWMIVDKKRVAYARLPAGELLHSTSMEFTGKYCGQMHNIFLKKPGVRASGPSGWAVQAKLMIYLWLSIRETSRSEITYIKGLPSGYDMNHPEMANARSIPPDFIHYEEEHTFQLRAYMYQARSLVGSDDSGLSDPFARVIIYNQCKETHYIDETLSPTWDQMLVFDNIRIHGDAEAIQKKPPLVIIEVYDYDTIGDPEFLGRSMVTPKVKLGDTPHEHPEWPPRLEWVDVFRGPRRSGQLLVAFELLQGDPSEFQLLPEATKRKRGWAVPLPPVIKPVLSKYRIEVMYWGVRELKRVQLLSVDRPRVEIECAGRTLKSTTIPSISKNCNFEVSPVNYLDVEMPDDEHYWPPITIRCYDCRSFGREVLVGVHTIANIQSYIYISDEEKLRRQAAKKALRDERKQVSLEKSKLKQSHLTLPNGSIAGSSAKLNKSKSGSMQSLGEDGRSVHYTFQSGAPSVVSQNLEVRSIISIKTSDDGVSMRRMFASQAPSIVNGDDGYSLPGHSSSSGSGGSGGSGGSRPPTVIGRMRDVDTASVMTSDGASMRNMFASRAPSIVVNGPQADTVSIMTMEDGRSMRNLFESRRPSVNQVKDTDVASVVNLDDGRSMRVLFDENPPLVQTQEGNILSMVMVDDGYSIRRMLASADIPDDVDDPEAQTVVTLGDGTSLRLMFEAPPTSEFIDGISVASEGLGLRRLYGIDTDDNVSIAPSTTSTNRKSVTIADDPNLRHIFGSRQGGTSSPSRAKGMDTKATKRRAEKGASPRVKYKKPHTPICPPGSPEIPRIVVTSESNPDIERAEDVCINMDDGASIRGLFESSAASVVSVRGSSTVYMRVVKRKEGSASPSSSIISGKKDSISMQGVQGADADLVGYADITSESRLPDSGRTPSITPDDSISRIMPNDGMSISHDDGVSLRRMFNSRAPSSVMGDSASLYGYGDTMSVSGMSMASLPSISPDDSISMVGVNEGAAMQRLFRSRQPSVVSTQGPANLVGYADGTKINRLVLSRPPSVSVVSFGSDSGGKMTRTQSAISVMKPQDNIAVLNIEDGTSLRVLFDDQTPTVQTTEGDLLSVVYVDDGHNLKQMFASADDYIMQGVDSDVTLTDGTSLRLLFETADWVHDNTSDAESTFSLRRLYEVDLPDDMSLASSMMSAGDRRSMPAYFNQNRHLGVNANNSRSLPMLLDNDTSDTSQMKDSSSVAPPGVLMRNKSSTVDHRSMPSLNKETKATKRPRSALSLQDIPGLRKMFRSNRSLASSSVSKDPSMYSISEHDTGEQMADGTSMHRMFSTPAQSIVSDDSVSIGTFGSRSDWDAESVVTAIEVDRISPIDPTDVKIIDGRKSILKTPSTSTSSPSRKSALDVKSVSQYPGSSPGTPRPDSRQSSVVIAMPDDVPLVAPDSISKSGGSKAPSVAGDGSPLKESKITRKVTAPQMDEKEKKRQKELMAELDWWSKYYATKRDLEKEEKDTQVGLNDEFQGLDFEGMDITKLREELSSADELDEPDDKFKKKMKKKAAKKKLKLKKIKAKQAKKQLKSMKGLINKAFKKDEADLVSLAGSQQEFYEAEDPDKAFVERITFYDDDLETRPEFNGFSEWVQTYDLFRGKKLGDDDDDLTRLAGKFKGTLIIYKPDDDGGDEDSDKRKPPELRLSKNLPPQKTIGVTVRIYILQAINLHPADLNGKADPYLIIRLGKHEVNDKKNKKVNNLNPVFGRLFELDARFPMDSILRIQIVDYDKYSSDDLIGETVIDLENRLFSKHRATCGISNRYEIFGYNTWRDPIRPTQILDKLCKSIKLDSPKYESGKVTVGGEEFHGAKEIEDFQGNIRPTDEHVALEALKSFEEVPGGFPVVPEHIETRKLYDPEKPGVEQGRLEMWVDLFPTEQPAPHVTIDVTPRKPQAYELRVVIWNTDEVVLEDTNPLTGEASSDIFVRGFVHGRGEDDHQTDIHYRSMSGEGNFNWRFIFPFEYLKAEEKILKKGNSSLFSNESEEERIPAHLTLQVWDADIVSADDFLGSLLLDMNKMPRPAKDAKNATLDLLRKDGSVPTLNLFKQKRVKGWWPFEGTDEQTKERSLVGKVEAEIHLMTTDEAEKSPAGLGREAPDPLSEPNRPDSSFLWFMNPLKTLKYIIWKNYKWLILKVFLLLLLIAFIALFFYAFPGEMVSNMF